MGFGCGGPGNVPWIVIILFELAEFGPTYTVTDGTILNSGLRFKRLDLFGGEHIEICVFVGKYRAVLVGLLKGCYVGDGFSVGG
jgi:hypothetical protein